MLRVMALLVLVLTGCATTPSPSERIALADALSAAQGWQALTIPAGEFELVAQVPLSAPATDVLTVYIEGDGHAWSNRRTPSTDPTPRHPLALQLALAHPHGQAAYLARPCQFVDAVQTACPPRYWTAARFAEAVIEASDQAVDRLLQRAGAEQLVLVGYSGGGAVAALLAARRDDVVALVTVAGNLDHRAWTAHHRLLPLTGSLNAADVAGQLADLPQTHFLGQRDRVIPPTLASRWPQAFTGAGNRQLVVVPEFDHACCWVEQWPSLLPMGEL